MTSAPPPRIRQTTPAAARLTSASGWSLLVITALHIAVFSVQAPWGEWFDGDLRVSGADPESLAVFWAMPGGLVVPAILTGLLLLRLGRQRQRVGLAFAFTLIAWVAFCVWIIGVSGFLAVLVSAGLVIASVIAERRAPSPVAEPEESVRV